MSWTRRSVLLSMLGITAAAGGGVTVWRWAKATPTPEDFVVELLRRRLAHLKVDQPSLRAFASEHLARAQPGERAELEGAASATKTIAPLFGRLRAESSRTAFARRQLERRLIARFMLGSDVFRQDVLRQDVGQATRFVAYPDPYEIGCANPLASLDEAGTPRGAV